MLDVTRLRVLVAVARHGSVTAAARSLNYAQPSVSHHLARLEAETGTQLTQRAGRGIALTEAGRLLVGRAEEILGRLDAAEAELATHLGRRGVRIRLAGFPSALATIVATAAARLGAGQPEAELVLAEAAPPEAVRLLRAGQVDVALVFQFLQDGEPVTTPDAADGLRSRLVLEEPVHLVLPAGPGQPGAGGEGGADVASVALADYAQHRWIGGCQRCRAHLRWQCERAGFTPRIALSTDSAVAAQALVAAGLGIALLPDLALRAARHPGVRTIPLPGARRRVLALSYGEPADLPAAARLFGALSAATVPSAPVPAASR